jgi:putative phosphoesterase
MRVAVFADVHGNTAALEAVLGDIGAQRPDLTVCGGDLAFGGPDPEAAVARIRALGVPCVRGNTDEWLTPTSAARAEGLIAYTRAHLSPAAREFLGTLPFDHRIDDLVVLHATPWSISDVIPRHADAGTIRRVLADAGASAVVYGHIHQAWIGAIDGGLLVNTGSVGFPYDGDPRPSYALLERGTSGWTAEILRVPYDLERAARSFPNDHPAAAAWAAMIRTGRRM